MNRKLLISNAILWAAAIIASALSRSSPFYTTILLPSLAVSALLVSRPEPRSRPCAR